MLRTETFYFLGPEILLVFTAVVLYVRGAFLRSGSQPTASTERPQQDVGSLQIALVGVVLAGWLLGRIGLPTEEVGPLLFDPLGLYLRWLALIGIGLLVLIASAENFPGHYPEYLGTLLLAGAGSMMVTVADNLGLLFLALELVSIPTYILLGLGRRDSLRTEAAAKYFFLSILASALVLYGMSFLYGATGSLKLEEMSRKLSASRSFAEEWLAQFTTLGMVLVLAGLGFKVTAVPFHFYAPDVYQGTSYSNAALLSVAPKIAGVTALVRILAEVLTAWEGYSLGWRVVLALAILTMTVGNVVALWQEHLRRLLAYSSIGQAGYILAALAVGLGSEAEARLDGLAAVLLYVAVYVLATLGAFSVLAGVRQNGRSVETLEELAGLSRHRPWSAACLAVCMFSLAGVPPLAGFWGKWAVVFGALKTGLWPTLESGRSIWFFTLAGVTMLNAAVAAAYYLRVAAAAYFRPPAGVHTVSGSAGPWLAAAVCAGLCVLIGMVPWPLWNAAGSAVESLEPLAGGIPQSPLAPEGWGEGAGLGLMGKPLGRDGMCPSKVSPDSAEVVWEDQTICFLSE